MGRQTEQEVVRAVVRRWSAGCEDLGCVLLIEATPVGIDASCLAGATSVERWSRFDAAQRAPWPPPGEWDTVVVRSPRSREELKMWVDVAASRVRTGGKVVMLGRNDEGIRGAQPVLEGRFREVLLALTKHRCRVFVAKGPRSGAKGEMEAWAVAVDAQVGVGVLSWLSLPGCFAHGRLDTASALLAKTLPACCEAPTVLDYGCGAGALTSAVRSACPAARCTMLDVDALSLAAAASSHPEAEVVQSDGFSGLVNRRFDWVVSNPPFHVGNAMTYAPVRSFLEEVEHHLSPGGRLWVVTSDTLPVQRLVQWAHMEAVATQRGFVVWTGKRLE